MLRNIPKLTEFLKVDLEKSGFSILHAHSGLTCETDIPVAMLV